MYGNIIFSHIGEKKLLFYTKESWDDLGNQSSHLQMGLFKYLHPKSESPVSPPGLQPYHKGLNDSVDVYKVHSAT